MSEDREAALAVNPPETVAPEQDFERDENGKIAHRDGEDWMDYARRTEKCEAGEGWPCGGEDAVAQGMLADGIEWRAYASPAMRRAGSFDAAWPEMDGGLNGYVKFSTRPMGHGYDELHGVRVHGGITYYSATVGGGCVYGFDTMHYRSEEVPRRDPEWIRLECEAMARGVLAVAAGLDPEDRPGTLPDLIGMLAAAMREAASDGAH